MRSSVEYFRPMIPRPYSPPASFARGSGSSQGSPQTPQAPDFRTVSEHRKSPLTASLKDNISD
ncbi:hypothetical protein DPMN_104713 [Dreissena polymorpha]|uniref:Uncharacterized protein n=1 Tax=Dreissena polymorpha TaxID=45954 RepID=A0A9D4HDL3_DREPO|nr:hypothetical protein DPMN_104713 [Dreissena polymorpha]